jgi:hypothetical protein
MAAPALKWIQRENFILCIDLPEWPCGPRGFTTRWMITIEPRPHYCDRGRYIARVDAPIDYQEGFPRYYFDLEVAKQEMAEWVAVRHELKPPRPFCIGCGKRPEQLPECVEGAKAEGFASADEFVEKNEGTFNARTKHFLCTSCYIAAGMPGKPDGQRKAP